MQRKFFSFLLAAVALVLLGGAASAQQQFTAGLNTIQENPPTNTGGRGSCVVTLNAAQTQISVSCEYSGLSSGLTAAHIHGPAAPGVNTGVLFNFNPPTGATSGTITAGPFTLTPANLADLRGKRYYINLHTTNFPNGEIRGQVKIQTTPFDYDGDGRTDVRVYRPSAITTFIQSSLLNNTFFSNVFGFSDESTFSSISDDFDGDGRSDIVLLSGRNGGINWRVLQTRSNTIREVPWGNPETDDRTPADYDGDAKTDIAVYRYTTGVWYILQSSNNQPRYEFWGQAGNGNEYGVVGDFDGDGKNDLTVIRLTAGGILWSTKRSSDNGTQVVTWGNPNFDGVFTAAQVDVDGDGIQDRMVVRDPNPTVDGTQPIFLALRSSDNGQFVLPFGLDTDTLRIGDYDGDGKTDFAARRLEGGIYTWYIAISSNNWNTANPRVVRFGQTNDLLTGDSEAEEFPMRYAPTPMSGKLKSFDY